MINSTFNPASVNDYDKSKMQLAMVGVLGPFIAGTKTNIDLALTDDMLLDGIEIFCKGHVFGDSITMQVVDINNVLGYGANLVLKQFCTNFLLSDDSQKQLFFQGHYPAKIYGGLYLRTVYSSTGNLNGVVAANYMLHKVLV